MIGRAFILLCGLIAAAMAYAAPTGKAAPRKQCEGLGDPSFFRDEGINMKVTSKLKFNKALLRESIQTKTNGGIVTLYGNVSTVEHAALAAKLAAEVDGVRCVSNYLVVGPPEPRPESSTPY